MRILNDAQFTEREPMMIENKDADYWLMKRIDEEYEAQLQKEQKIRARIELRNEKFNQIIKP